MSIFPSIFCTNSPLSLCMESTSYVLSFRMVCFYLVTTGWILDISLCENFRIGAMALSSYIVISSEFPPRGDVFFFRKTIAPGVTQR